MSSSRRAVWPLVACTSVALLAAGCANTAMKPAATVPEPAARAAGAQAVPTSAMDTSTGGHVAAPESGPPLLTYDIGEQCFRYRYLLESHCTTEKQLADCQAAVADGDCGIQLPFTLTKAWCQQIVDGEAEQWHVICQGYPGPPPLPTPQCPGGDQVLAPAVGTCADSCASYCLTDGCHCTGGTLDVCYSQYEQACDCGIVTCPPPGPGS